MSRTINNQLVGTPAPAARAPARKALDLLEPRSDGSWGRCSCTA